MSADRICDGVMAKSTLTAEQITRLDKIGMVWEKRSVNKWESGYEAAKKYRKRYGNLNVPMNYVDADGYKLRAWIDRQRLVYRRGTISPLRKERLDSIDMVWEPDTWENRFALVREYFEKHGTLRISQKLVVEGVWIGKWIVMQKRAMEAGKLSGEQREKLLTLPMEQVGRG